MWNVTEDKCSKRLRKWQTSELSRFFFLLMLPQRQLKHNTTYSSITVSKLILAGIQNMFSVSRYDHLNQSMLMFNTVYNAYTTAVRLLAYTPKPITLYRKWKVCFDIEEKQAISTYALCKKEGWILFKSLWRT